MPGIINGGAWMTSRRRFLEEELAKGPAPEQRAAIEAELAALRVEQGARRRHMLRWLRWGSRPPT